MSSSRAKIIYIMGAGRSGTTLLDILLGNSPAVLSCGELTRYAELLGIPRAADQGSTTSRFWDGFRKDLVGRTGPLDFGRLVRYYREFDHHRGFLRNYSGTYTRGHFRGYAAYLRHFFDALSCVGEGKVVVDSSKYANRALTLSRIFERRISYVYVVRDPIAVVRSFSKKNVEQPPRSWLSANLYYFNANLMCSPVGERISGQNQVLTVLYEDLVNDTAGVLRKISETFEIDLQEAIGLADQRLPFKVGTLFDGNRLRLERQVLVRRDTGETTVGLRDRICRAVNDRWRQQESLRSPKRHVP